MYKIEVFRFSSDSVTTKKRKGLMKKSRFLLNFLGKRTLTLVVFLIVEIFSMIFWLGYLKYFSFFRQKVMWWGEKRLLNGLLGTKD